MLGQRVLFGLGRVPQGIPPHDPRLPGVVLGAGALRLNSQKLGGRVDGHAARWAALRTLLQAGCGDYGGRQRGLVDGYLNWVAAAVEGSRGLLEQRLRRFEGIYAVEDWSWSALRPLPRAWVPTDRGYVSVGVAFWTGEQLLVSEAAPGLLAVTRLGTGWSDGCFGGFWEREVLPVTPLGVGVAVDL